MERIGELEGVGRYCNAMESRDRHGGEVLHVITGMGPNRGQRSLTQLTHDVNST